MRYAARTSVSCQKSRAEIESTLTRYGATQFAYGTDGDRAMVGFSMHNRKVRFMLGFPARDSREFTKGRYGHARKPEIALRLWEQACRQRWRALALVVKAKLEAVLAGIATFEEEFLAHIMLPDGHTVGDFMLPQIAIAYECKKMPPLLPYLTERKR